MKKKLIIGAALLAIVVAVRMWIDHRNRRDAVEFAPVLKENEREKIIVNTRSGMIRRVARRTPTLGGNGPSGTPGRNPGEETVTDISGVRKVAVTIDKDGSVKVYAPTKGVIFEPGLAAFYSDENFRLGFDVQFFYWRRFGLNAGAGSTLEKPYSVKAFVAGSYNIYSNTSVIVGITQTKEIATGVRVRF